jgi:hypothetical protein
MTQTESWPSADAVIAHTRSWLAHVVIGLGLCPFAKPVFVKEQIRYVVSNVETPEALLEALLDELSRLLDEAPERVDTTLLIHPRALRDFLDYNDFLNVVEAALEDLQLDGELQVASFHPGYLYEGNAADDSANFVTRSPYPMLHLLRESSIDRAVAAFPDASQIVDKNKRTLRALGQVGWQRLMSAVLSDRG